VVTARVVEIGSWHGVVLEAAAWDGAAAEVDLSAACLFTHEADGVQLGGGAKHLDDALGGALLRLRGDGCFRARLGDTLLLDQPPPAVAGGSVLVIGVGDPSAWTPEASGLAAGITASIALFRGAASVAFAPSLLDAGVGGADPGEAMLLAVAGAISAAVAAADMGLASKPKIRRFVFDAGAARLDAAAESFARALATLKSAVPSGSG